VIGDGHATDFPDRAAAPPDRLKASCNPEHFRRTLGHYPTGVCVVTAIEPDGAPVGMAVGSFSSVSLDPPLVGFLPDKASTSWPRINRAGRFCVNVLARGQEDLCRRFSAKAESRFEGLDFDLTRTGSPVFPGSVAWIDCTLWAVHEAGDHYFVLGEVQAMEARTHQPLLFLRGQFGGFAPS
jgi:3-hydroxy-9,10-secoandrosta-1,3,5(10)-triene-9,17-dione monooxygenase reductase component